MAEKTREEMENEYANSRRGFYIPDEGGIWSAHRDGFRAGYDARGEQVAKLTEEESDRVNEITNAGYWSDSTMRNRAFDLLEIIRRLTSQGAKS